PRVAHEPPTQPAPALPSTPIALPQTSIGAWSWALIWLPESRPELPAELKSAFAAVAPSSSTPAESTPTFNDLRTYVFMRRYDLSTNVELAELHRFYCGRPFGGGPFVAHFVFGAISCPAHVTGFGHVAPGDLSTRASRAHPGHPRVRG